MFLKNFFGHHAIHKFKKIVQMKQKEIYKTLKKYENLFFSQCVMIFARKTSKGPHIAEFSGRFLRISQAFCTQAAEYTHHYHIISIIWVNPHAPKVPPPLLHTRVASYICTVYHA